MVSRPLLRAQKKAVKAVKAVVFRASQMARAPLLVLLPLTEVVRLENPRQHQYRRKLREATVMKHHHTQRDMHSMEALPLQLQATPSQQAQVHHQVVSQHQRASLVSVDLLPVVVKAHRHLALVVAPSEVSSLVEHIQQVAPSLAMKEVSLAPAADLELLRLPVDSVVVRSRSRPVETYLSRCPRVASVALNVQQAALVGPMALKKLVASLRLRRLVRPTPPRLVISSKWYLVGT